MQDRKDDVLQVLRERMPELLGRFTVRRIGIFGSFVKDIARPDSDVDVVVELNEPTFDHYMDLKFYLEEILGRPVDLVLHDSIKPRLRPIIDQEVVYA